MVESDQSSQSELNGIQLWTVGHSTLSADDFRHLLSVYLVQVSVDVRSYPGSRRYPQFNKSTLTESIAAGGISYIHAPLLGGRRQGRADSKNTAWQNASFRAYADYMETAEFKEGVKGLLDLATMRRVAIMCAEALWWRCHRSLISDYLKASGHLVVHILDAKKTEVHPFTAAARIVDGELTYRGLLP